MITIVMYHYVRNIKNSFYPNIKGLEIKDFKKQVKYLKNKYNIITMENLINCFQINEKVPSNSFLLTFDDGHKDHYKVVFPILDELNIQGSFFPSYKVIATNTVLDINKIHFILEKVNNLELIINEIHTFINKFKNKYNLKSFSFYANKLKNEKLWFDTKEVIFIKRMLQRELPLKPRKKIINYLFNKYVTKYESAFSQEFYLNVDQLKCMDRNGMHIGNHGYDHNWLNTLSYYDQKKDIDLSIKFFKKINKKNNKMTFCYPCGAYNKSLLKILKKDFVLGLTTRESKISIKDIKKMNPLLLPRIDANIIKFN